MTPEQLASLPDRVSAPTAAEVEAVGAINHLLETLQAERVLREYSAFPVGHPDRQVRPAHVREWEAKHGKAPESARRFLDGR